MELFCTGICRYILRKTTKPPSMTRCPTQFSNTKPPEYKPETRASVFSRAILHRSRLSMILCLFSVRLVGWLVGRQAKHEDTEMSRRTCISHIRIILLFIDFSHTHTFMNKTNHTRSEHRWKACQCMGVGGIVSGGA